MTKIIVVKTHILEKENIFSVLKKELSMHMKEIIYLL